MSDLVSQNLSVKLHGRRYLIIMENIPPGSVSARFAHKWYDDLAFHHSSVVSL